MARYRAETKFGVDTMPETFLTAYRVDPLQMRNAAAAKQNHPVAESRKRYSTAETTHV
jgi:hypothetical protein